MSFSYDVQHDQIVASGVQLKPSVKSNAIAPTTGTITLTININVVSHFARGTVFHCSVAAIGGSLDLANGVVDGGLETANGVASPSGPGTATCTLVIPYSWTLLPDPAAVSGLVLSFGAAAVTTRGDTSIVQRSTLQVDGIESLPASGSSEKFTFDVTL
jgi:hypothetical protein